MEPKVADQISNSDVKQYIGCQFDCMDAECQSESKNATTATLCVVHQCLPKLDKCSKDPECMQQLRTMKEAIHGAEDDCCPEGHCARPYGEVVKMPNERKAELIRGDPVVVTMFKPATEQCAEVSACMREETAASDEILAGYMECQFDCMESNCDSGADANQCVVDKCMAELVDCPRSQQCMAEMQGMKKRIKTAEQKCCEGGKCDDEPYKTVLATTVEQKMALIASSEVLGAFEHNMATMSAAVQDDNCTKATECMQSKVMDGLSDDQVKSYVECQFHCMQSDCGSGNSTHAFVCEVQTCLPLLQNCGENSECSEEARTLKARIASAEESCCPNGTCGEPYQGLMKMSRVDKQVLMATAAYQIEDPTASGDNCTKATKCMEAEIRADGHETTNTFMQCQFACVEAECQRGASANGNHTEQCVVDTCMPILQNCPKIPGCLEHIQKLHDTILAAEQKCCPDGSCGKPYSELMSMSAAEKGALVMTNTRVVEAFEQAFVM
jgi:hypothetical protein